MAKHDLSKIKPADLTEAQAKAELKRLSAEIAAHDKRYYLEDKPVVTDAAYDALRERNAAIEQWFPHLVRTDSPSRRVGAAPTGRFRKVRHAVPMLSLDNASTEQDVVDFVARIRRFLKLSEDEKISLSAEPKIDGLSMSLRYENGELIIAATRGDGAEGEDVTANIRTLKDVPQQLKGRHVSKVTEVRGEVYMTKKAFLALNERSPPCSLSAISGWRDGVFFIPWRGVPTIPARRIGRRLAASPVLFREIVVFFLAKSSCSF